VKKTKQEKRDQLPFFTRFLVKQELEEVGGQRYVTMKWPSDDDEAPST
jgi:hypothetical protein